MWRHLQNCQKVIFLIQCQASGNFIQKLRRVTHFIMCLTINLTEITWPNLNYLKFVDFSSDSSSVPTKRAKLPVQFFEFLGDVPGKNAGFYKCTFPNCLMKKDKNGKEKPLIVYNNTRANAKRHFCVSYKLYICHWCMHSFLMVWMFFTFSGSRPHQRT